jgi:hypothetical protein
MAALRHAAPRVRCGEPGGRRRLLRTKACPPTHVRTKTFFLLGSFLMAVPSCGGSAPSVALDGGSAGGSSSSAGGSTGSGPSDDGESSAAGGSSGAGQPSSSSSGNQGPTQSVIATQGDASLACTVTPGGGTAGGASCTAMMQETCGSATYYATCSCPEGTCGCVGPTTTSVVNFKGCPACPGFPEVGSPTWFQQGVASTRAIFALCGFPH